MGDNLSFYRANPVWAGVWAMVCVMLALGFSYGLWTQFRTLGPNAWFITLLAAVFIAVALYRGAYNLFAMCGLTLVVVGDDGIETVTGLLGARRGEWISFEKLMTWRGSNGTRYLILAFENPDARRRLVPLPYPGLVDRDVLIADINRRLRRIGRDTIRLPEGF